MHWIALHGTEDQVGGVLLGVQAHLIAILLVVELDGNEVGEGHGGGG